jgi:hypothetical protein
MPDPNDPNFPNSVDPHQINYAAAALADYIHRNPSTLYDENGSLRPRPEIQRSPFFGNAFMQNHPALGGALNRALLSAAMTPAPNGPEGAGAGISRALQGVLGGQQYQTQFEHAQEMYPVEQGAALAKLYGAQNEADLYKAHADYFRSMPGERMEAAQLRYLAQEHKLGQPVHTVDGQLLGYMGANGFQSAHALGIPDEASTAKPNTQTPRYNIEAYTSAVVHDSMTRHYGQDQSKWPAEVPIDIWQGAIGEAQKQFKVLPAEPSTTTARVILTSAMTEPRSSPSRG